MKSIFQKNVRLSEPLMVPVPDIITAECHLVVKKDSISSSEKELLPKVFLFPGSHRLWSHRNVNTRRSSPGSSECRRWVASNKAGGLEDAPGGDAPGAHSVSCQQQGEEPTTHREHYVSAVGLLPLTGGNR